MNMVWRINISQYLEHSVNIYVLPVNASLIQLDKDVWHFQNTGYKKDINEEKPINNNDWEKLIAGLSAVEKEKLYNQYINPEGTSGGSCWGLSAIVIINKMHGFQNDMFLPGETFKNNYSLITYYHWQQFLNKYTNIRQKFGALSDHEKINSLLTQAEEIENNGTPLLIDIGDYNGETRENGHTIVGYQLIRNLYNVDGEYFNYLILCYDSNAYPKGGTADTTPSYYMGLFINSTSDDWVYAIYDPKNNTATRKSIFNHSPKDPDKDDKIECVTNKIEFIDIKNYYSNMTIRPELILDSSDMVKFTINGITYYANNNHVSGDLVYYSECDSLTGTNVLHVVLPDNNIVFERGESTVPVKAQYQDSDSYVKINANADSVVIKDKAVELANNYGDYSISFTSNSFNDDVMPSYTVEGSCEGNLTLTANETGIELSGNIEEGTVIKSTDYDEKNNEVVIEEDKEDCRIEDGEILLETDPSDFVYAVSDGEIRITKYVGDNTNVVIPSKIDGYPVTALYNTFHGNTNIRNVRLPETLREIQYGVFYDCKNLESVTIPKGVTSIGGNSFENCEKLTHITIPNTVTRIVGSNFNGCSSISIAGPIGSGSNIEFGWTESIPGSAFSGCKNLTSIIIPDSITDIGSAAFHSCESLKSIEMPKGLKTLGKNAFHGCSSLENISIPDGIEEIGESEFYECISLSEVTIPKSVVSIISNAFYGCSNLQEVHYGGSEDEWKSVSIGSRNDPLLKAKVIYNWKTVENIVLNKTSISLLVGEKQTLAATISPSDAADKTLTWKSSNSTIADVSQNGEVIAKKAGTATITATSNNGISATCMVTVNPKTISVSSIKLNKTSAELPTNKTLELTATVSPTDATDKNISWTSSNTKVATVDSSGKVTANSYGTTVITASSVNAPSIKASCTIQTRFYDVNDSSQYYYKPVYWGADNGIVVGFDGSRYYGPQQSCTRAQFVIFLWRIAGRPTASGTAVKFTDIAGNENYYKAIQWAVSKGIIGGYKDGTFKPDKAVNRVEVAIMLWKYAGRPNVSTAGNSPFKDISLTNTPTLNSYKAVLWGQKMKIIKGYSDGTFKPYDDCLREHIVTFLYRYARDVLKWKV